MEPELSIIIVSYNVRDLLLNCVRSIIDTVASIDYEIIIVDNASNDGSAAAVREAFPQIQLIANRENIGFASANNQGYAMSKGDFLLLLNPDTIVKPNAIKSVVDFLRKTPAAGMAACRLLNPDGSLQKSIRPLPSIKEQISRALLLDHFLYREYLKTTYYRSRPFEIGYCTGAFMMVRRKALGEMLLLNPEFFMYAEEKDLALRLKEKGWKTYFVPGGEIIHFREQSTNQMPVEMFLELQKSQVKYFNHHFYGLKKNLMIWSYYLSLCTYCIGSILLPFSHYGRYRLKLFIAAVRNYPALVSKLNG